jgi:hypothetical protein
VTATAAAWWTTRARDLRRQDGRDPRPRPGPAPPRRDLCGGREVDRPVRLGSGADRAWGAGGLLEDRPQPHETPGQGDRRAGGVREVGPLLSRRADRPRLRRRNAGGGRDLQAPGPQPGALDVGPAPRPAADLVHAHRCRPSAPTR